MSLVNYTIAASLSQTYYSSLSMQPHREQNRSGNFVMPPEKSFGNVIGEQVVGPLIDRMGNVASSFFQLVKWIDPFAHLGVSAENIAKKGRPSIDELEVDTSYERALRKADKVKNLVISRIATHDLNSLSIDCPSYAFPNGITGPVTAQTNPAQSVIIPMANGSGTVTAWVENPAGTSRIMVAVNNKSGVRPSPPMQINIGGYPIFPADYVAGAPFGNGKIGICYGSYDQNSQGQANFLVLSPDGSTVLARTFITIYGINLIPKTDCGPLNNGNIQFFVPGLDVYGIYTKAILWDFDSAINTVGVIFISELPPGPLTRGISLGQYPTGQRLLVLNDALGLQARVYNATYNTLLYTRNLILNGDEPDPTFDPVTVNTMNGPVTFWRTVTWNLHAGRVNPTNGKLTVVSIDNEGSAEFAEAATNYDPKNPTQPEYLAVVINKGGVLGVKVLDAATLTEVGCDTPIGTIKAESGNRMSVAFFSDRETLRTAWGEGNLNITDFKLNHAPTLESVPPQNATIGEFKCTRASGSDSDSQPLTWNFGLNGATLPEGFNVTESNGTATICWDLPPGFPLRGDEVLNIGISDGYYNGTASLDVPFHVLNRNPSIVSGPTGIQTAFSNTPPITTWIYLVTGTDPDGDVVSVYLDSDTDPAVSANGKYLVMTVTPADVGRTIEVSYAIEDGFGGISPSQTVTFTVPDRFPVVRDLIFPEATAGVFYSFNLPGDTFTEPDGQATEQFFINLPDGLRYNAATNSVEGVPLEKSMMTMKKTQTFAVDVSNKQTINSLTTTRTLNLIVNPNPLAKQGEDSKLRTVQAIFGLVVGSITGAGLVLNGIIASRVIQYKAPADWKTHQRNSLPRRIIYVIKSSLAICVLPAARGKAQEEYNLNFWGGKRNVTASPLEMGNLEDPDNKNTPLLSDKDRSN